MIRVWCGALCSFILTTVLTSFVYSEGIAEASQRVNGNVPFVSARTLINGVVREENGKGMPLSDVYACCTSAQECATNEDGSNNCTTDNNVLLSRTKIGALPQFSQAQALGVLGDAKKAWDGGAGVWPQMSIKERIAAVEALVATLRKDHREAIVEILMWEIGKNRSDAESEFDRTMIFIEKAIDFIRTSSEFSTDFAQVDGTSTRAFTRRAAIGIIMCLGPMNYPLNETYATLIPALLMGNVVIMKIPTVGGLAHLITMEAFAKALPKGAIHLISGGGRATMPPLMKTGDIDGLAFIGGSQAADELIRQHPQPHRLKVFLQLEAKNMGIVLPDLFKPENEEAMNHALNEIVTGSLSFNGQRCTAIKIIFVPAKHALDFATRLSARISNLRVGLPWQQWDDTSDSKNNKPLYSHITPLPSKKRIDYMQKLIANAKEKGAKVLNSKGGQIIGGEGSTLMKPALLFPVIKGMDLYVEEQFGPVVPVTPYEDLKKDVLKYGTYGPFGQQVALFTADGTSKDTLEIIDRFSSVFGKININSQCQRSPDTLPFSGRRSSAMGVMSVADALREFSVPTVVAYKGEKNLAEKVARGIHQGTKFMESVL